MKNEKLMCCMHIRRILLYEILEICNKKRKGEGMNKIIEYLKSLFGNEVSKEQAINDLAKEIETQIKNETATALSSVSKQNAQAVQTPAAHTPTTGVSATNPDVQKILTAFDTVKAENKKLSDALADVLKKEADRENALKTKAEKEMAEKIAKALKEANEDGRIPPKNEELNKKYKSLLEKDYETAMAIINALPKNVKNENANTQDETSKGNTSLEQFTSRQKLMEEAKEAFKSENE